MLLIKYFGDRKNMKKYIKQFIGINNIVKIKSVLYFRRNPLVKDLLANNIQFKNRYRNERCFIIGNGPSISKIDFSKLENEYTFSVNQLPRNPKFEKLKTNFHVWADERFFNLDENKTEDMELLDVMQHVNTANNKPVVFYKYAAYEMIKKFKLDEMLDIYYYDQISFDNTMLEKWKPDFTQLVPGFGTVVQYIICLAVYMGFSEIIMLGCDCTGIVSTAQARIGKAENSTYGYEISKNEKKRIEKIQSATSFRDEMQWYVSIFDDYENLMKFCKKNRVKLINATNPTLLECVERVDLEEIL